MLVDAELARAIRTESASAIRYWWGVSSKAVWHWRRALDVSHWGTQGSQRLHQQLSEAGADVLRGVKLSAEQVEQRRQTAISLGYQPKGDGMKEAGSPKT